MEVTLIYALVIYPGSLEFKIQERRLLRVPWTARRSALAAHWKDWCWSWSSNALATWCEELSHWERPWYWERLKAGGEGNDRGWDGWMASATQWTWVWVNSASWWWTWRPDMLQSMGLQRVGRDWVTELFLSVQFSSVKNIDIFIQHLSRFTFQNRNLTD